MVRVFMKKGNTKTQGVFEVVTWHWATNSNSNRRFLIHVCALFASTLCSFIQEPKQSSKECVGQYVQPVQQV